MASRKKFLCLDCKIDTLKIGEHYFVKNNVWLPVVGSNKGMLCIGCLESRIKRKLTPSDFVQCHLHRVDLHFLSEKLKKRLGVI